MARIRRRGGLTLLTTIILLYPLCAWGGVTGRKNLACAFKSSMDSTLEEQDAGAASIPSDGVPVFTDR